MYNQKVSLRDKFRNRSFLKTQPKLLLGQINLGFREAMAIIKHKKVFSTKVAKIASAINLLLIKQLRVQLSIRIALPLLRKGWLLTAAVPLLSHNIEG